MTALFAAILLSIFTGVAMATCGVISSIKDGEELPGSNGWLVCAWMFGCLFFLFMCSIMGAAFNISGP